MDNFITDQLTAIKTFLNKSFFATLFYYFIFAAVFSLASKLLANFKPLIKLDVAIQQFIINQRADSFNEFFKLFTSLGDTKAMIAWTIITAIIFFAIKHYFYAIGIIFSVAIAELISFIIKNVIERDRPPELLSLISADSPSFPSGHTIAAITFWGFLIYVFYKTIQNKFWRNILILICALIIIAAGFTRIYLGVHWPSDIIAGYILGGAWILIVIKRIEKQKMLENQ